MCQSHNDLPPSFQLHHLPSWWAINTSCSQNPCKCEWLHLPFSCKALWVINSQICDAFLKQRGFRIYKTFHRERKNKKRRNPIRSLKYGSYLSEEVTVRQTSTFTKQ
ncbi:hypothetical protein AMECASPLE_030826 [Ameca splendens]|uniref:Uncharacterized protein n=1 Tax=Ameca splendens TaxID=208324 RepID=A0ABV0Z413_9TELE